MKPTTYRTGFQELLAVDVDSRRATFATAGGGLSRPLGGSGVDGRVALYSEIGSEN